MCKHFWTHTSNANDLVAACQWCVLPLSFTQQQKRKHKIDKNQLVQEKSTQRWHEQNMTNADWSRKGVCGVLRALVHNFVHFVCIMELNEDNNNNIQTTCLHSQSVICMDEHPWNIIWVENWFCSLRAVVHAGLLCRCCHCIRIRPRHVFASKFGSMWLRFEFAAVIDVIGVLLNLWQVCCICLRGQFWVDFETVLEQERSVEFETTWNFCRNQNTVSS